MFESLGIFIVHGSYGLRRSKSVVQDFSIFRSALNIFEHSSGRLPTTSEGLDALVRRPEGWGAKDYEPTLKSEILDPWQNSYRYEFPSPRGRAGPDITSAGPDMIFGTEDDIGNWEIESL
ncbi:MAG: type II secretion system protein GspG [Verrucomicrobiales bacterium]